MAGRKRKANAESSKGARKKQKKVTKENSKGKDNNANHGKNDDDDEDEPEKIVTRKVPLRKILRPRYRTELTKAITEKAMQATKICHLGSLLFLTKVQKAFDAQDKEFFDKNAEEGEQVITDCFYGVIGGGTGQHAQKMCAEFRQEAVRFDDEIMTPFQWPNNEKFGNALNDLRSTYTTNVKTNLHTHRKKRLYQYLNMFKYKNNIQDPPPQHVFTDADIKHTIAWAIHGSDTIRGDGADKEEQRERRRELLQAIQSLSWYPIRYTNVSGYTKWHWFKSIQMWIAMQRKIDEFNCDNDARIDRMERRRQQRHGRQQKPSTEQEPKTKTKSPENVMKPPKVKNLAVIPICDIQRAHYPIDNYTFWYLLKAINECPKTDSKRKRNGEYKKDVPFNDFLRDKAEHWNRFLYLRKIRYFVRFRKTFRFRFLSDGISASLQYDVDNANDKKKSEPVVDKAAAMVAKFNRGEIPVELGIDPGDKTWLSVVRREHEHNKEVNITISSKQYHWLAHQPERNRKAERWTKAFDDAAKADREDRNLYTRMPSEMGVDWWDYVRHRLKFMQRGLDVYATDKYTRLSLDRYIRSNQVCDNVAGMLTRHKACIVHFGNATMAPNRAIRIKKHVRCPGQRKMLTSFSKQPQCYINMTDEYFTSQTCARCFKRFDRRTRNARFKVCTDCEPDERGAMLPAMIVGRKSKRMRRSEKESEAILRGYELEEDDDLIAATRGLLSKVMIYRKNWQVNHVVAVDAVDAANQSNIRPRKSSWDRDIVAARCILIKGHCAMFGIPVPATLQRPPPPPRNQQPEWMGVPVTA